MTKQQASSQPKEPRVCLCLGRKHKHWKCQRLSRHSRTVMTKGHHPSCVRRSTQDQSQGKNRKYVIHKQELKIEANKRGQIKIANWERRQQQNLRRVSRCEMQVKLYKRCFRGNPKPRRNEKLRRSKSLPIQGKKYQNNVQVRKGGAIYIQVGDASTI